MEQVLEPKSSETIFGCYNCGNEISTDALFCKSCGTQVKCKICKNVLEENSIFCISCGTQINSHLHSENITFNNFDYSQKGNSKTIKAKFTNEVGGYFAGLFNNVIGGHPLPQRNPFKNPLQISSGRIQNNKTNPAKDFSGDIQDAEIVSDYSAVIAKIFKENETGKLEVIDNRLKEKSSLDKMKRLTILFLYAKRLTGIDSVTRDDLNEIVNREKLADSSYRSFLSKEGLKYFSIKENGNLSLLAGGEDYAKEILEQIVNPDFSPNVSKAGRKAGRKSSKDSSQNTNNKDSQKSSSKPSALEICKALIEENFFDSKKTMSDIVTFCEEKKGEKYSPQKYIERIKKVVER